MKQLLVIAGLFVLGSASAQNRFTSTIMFGIEVPVFVWNGNGSAFDYALHVLDSNRQNQGTLLVLGRDQTSLWAFETGYDNDASEEGYYCNLVRITAEHTDTIIPTAHLQMHDTTFPLQFKRQYTGIFSGYKLNHLLPVDAWACPYRNQWVACVNNKELGFCATFYLDVINDRDDGSCVFYFEWSVGMESYNITRDVYVFNLILSIPSDWSYIMHEDSTGFIATGKDTLHFGACPTAMRLLNEETERNPDIFRLETHYDSVTWPMYNARVRHHNDSLRRNYSRAETDSIYSEREYFGHLVYFVPRNENGRLLVISRGVNFGEGDYYFESNSSSAHRDQFLQIIHDRKMAW
jgi:hypothetical protein